MTERTKTTVKVNEALGIKCPDGVVIEAFDQPCNWTPPKKRKYIFREDYVKGFLAWYGTRRAGGVNDGLWISGPQGCGKSTLPEQIAACLNWGAISYQCHNETESADLFGYNTAVGGEVVFQPGPAYIAASKGYLLILDEADRLHPSVSGHLRILLENRPIVVPETSQKLVPHKDFALVATGNTVNGDDDTGLFAGVQRQNSAYLDAFQTMPTWYPEEKIEVELVLDVFKNTGVSRITKTHKAVAKSMVRGANDARKKFIGHPKVKENEAINAVISTRGLLKWAALAGQYTLAGKNHPALEAMPQAFLNGMEPTEQEVIENAVRAHFKDGGQSGMDPEAKSSDQQEAATA